jgi:hypothetical protein
MNEEANMSSDSPQGERPESARPQEDRPEHTKPKQPAWIVGGVLILVGLVFVLKNVTGVELHNWWALFILIPALGSLVTACQMYVKNGRRFTGASQGPLIGGVLLAAVAAIFLFDIAWEFAWPFLLILAGGAVLLGAFRRRS